MHPSNNPENIDKKGPSGDGSINQTTSRLSTSLWALCPLMVFFGVFIGTGLYFSLQGRAYAFYQVSAAVAILPAILLALYSVKLPFQKAFNIFLEGVRDKNIVIMCLIYLLAGAFGCVLQSIGSVSSTVNFALQFVPAQASLPALFLLASVISTAMGTSMGTIAAIGPIGVGIAQSIGLPLPLTMGAIISGAMFGDNLSMVSDTSIAATQMQGCSAADKFKSNILVALPVMMLTLIILTWLGYQEFSVMESTSTSASALSTPIPTGDYKLLHCVPYVIVLGLALLGTNVFAVLVIGISSAAAVGIWSIPSYTLVVLARDIFEGYKNMSEILILSLLMGGLGELIKYNGGFAIIYQILNYFKRLKEKREQQAQNKTSAKNTNPKVNNPNRTAEAAIASIAAFSDICTANNTVAIILSGEVTREIARENQIPPARAATLVDLFACVFQGILPYSAQVLMAGSLAQLSPLSIVPYVHYCFLLGIAGLSVIFFRLKLVTPKKSLKVLDLPPG